MKRSIWLIVLPVLFPLAALTTACEDIFGDFLDKQPSNELTGEEVFALWTNAEKFHYDTYNFLRHGARRINRSWLDAATDLAHTSYTAGGTRTSFNIGNYYASSGAPELTGTWEHYYRGIRKCNMLLHNIDTVPRAADLSNENYERDKMNFKSESRFLRAYFYWELFLRYGPVPIIKDVLDPDGELLAGYTTRPSNGDFLDFVMRELAECEAGLMEKPDPATQDNLVGRVCKPVAAALRSRIALYMASPRYGLIGWQAAADTARNFITRYGSRYSLQPDYANAILTVVHQGNNEVIFWRNDTRVGWSAISDDSPVGEGGSGGLCPSQNLVDMYDMANGLSPFAEYDNTGAPVYDGTTTPAIHAASGYSEATPYAGRDPRFYASVLYHQATWNGAAIDVTRGGRDNPSGNANATPTGYYLKKYIPENILSNNHAGSAYRNWIFIRYAEILLNLAEAVNEVQGPCDEVFNALQLLRDRAGMTARLADRPDLYSQSALRNFIRKERAVELAFEEHRAWDLRRWNVAVEALARPIYGIEVTRDGSGDPLYTRKVVQRRIFSEKMYLYPIPESEVWKTNITNNQGWN
ncbi:MAG: RagB/SusD family nutrient uptake outer membrane protein [Odoribacteraceae bacterium]|jgi:hypothetical protein|nr:RagB/SusD family nutrient uptake outer membrane protein [Odoribacteraceae bacterium]